jgi:heme exporter protein C
MKWKYLTGLLIILVIVFSFLPPIAGVISDVQYFSQLDSTKFIPIKAKIQKYPLQTGDSKKVMLLVIDKTGNNMLGYSSNPDVYNNISTDYKILKVRWNKTENTIEILEGDKLSFFMTFPLIPGLEERSRIILFHVPVAWVSVLGFLVSMIFGIKYLIKRNIRDDDRSVAAAGLGLLFCILATLTGSIWAKFNWGSFWNWDPRETSIFILLIIYGAYFALRSAVDISEKRAVLSSIYSILSFITVPFFIFILPRITAGLHPGSADDLSTPGGGPVIKSGMSIEMRLVFFLSLIAFSMLFFWLLDLRIRATKISKKI